MTAEGAARHGNAVPRGQGAPPTGSRGGRFGRMFGFLPPCDPGPDAIDELVRLTQRPSSDNVAIPAGFTYLGQFIDHDITYDPTSKLQRDNDPAALVNFRTPRFDLDSLYGSGPLDQPFLYEWKDTSNRGVKLLVGHHGHPDLPRNQQGRALIGDARNDENLIVSQLHLLFIRFHNKVVDLLRGGPPALEGPELFEAAQRAVRWHYQWIVMHDFLERIVGKDVARSVLRPGADGRPPSVERRFYAWEDEPTIPVEFSGAAFRFGHSMVRSTYLLQTGEAAVPIFAAADADKDAAHLGGFRRLPASLAIEWDRFFFEKEEPDFTNSSLRIDNRLSSALFSLPPDGGVLPLLNLQRGVALGLPAGQDVAHAMGEDPLRPEELGLDAKVPEVIREQLLRATPLWYYVVCEAGKRGDGGCHLGAVGGRIVAEVLAGLLEADPNSYLRQWPAWRPDLGAQDGEFTMLDLVRLAQEDDQP
jgi:hypothetical protein